MKERVALTFKNSDLVCHLSPGVGTQARGF
jgi:hypothetical protein